MYVYETGTAHPSGAPAFTPGFSGVCVAQSLVFCVVFYLSFFTFGICIFCPSSIYDFWLSIVYLRIFLVILYFSALIILASEVCLFEEQS
jgi:hypothetical protein